MSSQQKIFTKLIVLLIGILCTNITFAQTLLYKETTSGRDSNIETVINRVENGYLVKVINSNKDEMTYYTNASFSVLKWKYDNPENGTDISAGRSGNTISITGQFESRKYEEKLMIDHLPWYQDWGLGLKAFIASDKNSTCFWFINLHDLKKTKFEACKKKIEIIEVNGQEIESVYVKISLTGWMKVLWSGAMWFRKSDGTYVYSKMKEQGPTGPITIRQLIKEE